MSDYSKSELRTRMKQKRLKTAAKIRATASTQICQRISALEIYQSAKQIALYQAIHGEIDLSGLWHNATKEQKKCFFPTLNENKTLAFLPADPTTPFKNNAFNIPEPDVDKALAVPIEKLDLILIPLVAFDFKCTRLGMGEGYYDRTLENKYHPMIIGVAYQFQLVNHIEPEHWDIPLDGVVTQRAIYWHSL